MGSCVSTNSPPKMEFDRPCSGDQQRAPAATNSPDHEDPASEKSASDNESNKASDEEDKESQTSGHLVYDDRPDKSDKSDKSETSTDDEEEKKSDYEKEKKSDDEDKNSNSDSDRSDEENKEDEEEGNGDDGGWLTGAVNIKEVAEKIIQGNVDIEVPSQVKLVRIFTSSTFTDTFIERNNLMERVYPKLKEYCQSVGYDFQVVDMRWGVRDEATEDHMTSELCMTEIRACQKLSTGPNFITFLGQKYGYRPFPPKIVQKEFEALLSAVVKEEDKDLLTKWFIRDENLVPPMYILQPVKELIPNYNNRSVSNEERSKASGEWWTAFEGMQEILREASIQALKKEEDIAKYRISVTEDEIRRGLLRVKDKLKHCYWFKRSIIDIDEHLDKPKARNFIDKASNELDMKALTLLNELRYQIIEILPEENIKEYDVKWCGESCINPKESEEHKAYIDKLCKDFYNTLVDMINKGIEEKKKMDLENSLVKEISLHTTTCQDKSRVFYGRDEVLDAIMNHAKKSLADDDNNDNGNEDETGKRILVVHGASGCGKTSIMAVAAKKIKEKYPDTAMILRFLGTTSESSTVGKMLYSVCCQLCHITKKELREIPETFKKMREFFAEQLKDSYVPKLVIILDSLDQLSADDGALAMKWLPKEVYKNVSIIVSTLPGDEYKVFPTLKRTLPKNAFVEVPVMPQSTAGEILDAWLKDAHHTITASQKDIVMKAFKECPLPLFLKLSFDEAKRWKSYTPIDESLLKSTVKEAINGMFARLERFHGFHLVSHGLGYITAAKNGISDAEMDDILSMDDDVLNDVYQYWTPPVRRIPPLLWIRIKTDLGSYIVSRGADGVLVNNWYHRQFIETARERYLKPEIATKIHETMADFFLGKWSGGVQKPFTSKQGDSSEKDRLVPAQPNIFPKQGDQTNDVYNFRKLNELPRHLLEIGNLESLKDNVIFNFEFLSAKLCALGLRNLLQDFSETLAVFNDEAEIKLLHDCLRMSGKGLLADPNQLAAQLNARLCHLDGYDRISDLLEQSRNANVPCLYPSVACFERPGGPLVHSLVGHTGGIDWAIATKDGKRLLSLSQDQTMRLWDLTDGTEMRSYDVSNWCTVARFYNDEKGVILAGHSGLRAMDLESEEIVFEDEYLTGQYGTCLDVIANGTKIVHAGAENISVFDVIGNIVKPVWTYEEKAAENSSGMHDTICGGGNYYGYKRGKDKELIIRKGSDQNFSKKLKVPYSVMYFQFDEGGKQFIMLGSNSKMNETYKEVHLVIYDTSSWNISKDSKSTFDAMIINIYDMALCNLKKGWEVIWPTMFQINFWNINTGVERVALKAGYQGSQHKRAFSPDGKLLVVVSLDQSQSAIQVYDLNLLEWIEEGDHDMSDIEKTRAYVGKGERDAYLVPSNPNILLSIPPADGVISIWDIHHHDRIRRIITEGLFPSALQYINETHIAIWDHTTRAIHLVNYIEETIEAATSGKVTEIPPTSLYTNTWCFLEEYTVLVVSENGKNIDRYDLKTGKLLGTIKTGESTEISSMMISDDKSTLIIAQKDYETQTVPAVCIDVKAGKKMSQITLKERRVDLRPEVTILSPDGKLLYLAFSSKTMEAYNTKTGQKVKEITYKPPRADDEDDPGYYDDSTVFNNITSSNAMGYIAACISCVEYVNGNYGQVYRLVCFDMATSDVLALGYCRYYLKMSASKDGKRLICLSQPMQEESKAIDIWDMSEVKEGKVTLLAKFLPETDVRFNYLTSDGNAVAVGIAGMDGLVFLRMCGGEKQKKRPENCIETKVVYEAVTEKN